MAECPNCGCKVGNRVTHTYRTEVNWHGKTRQHIRRRRVCRHCSYPYTTVEVLEDETKPGYPSPETPPKEVPKEPDNPFLPD